MKSAKEILTSTEKFHISLGLDRIKKILFLLNNPQDDYKIIHIAGTNGKGSTCKIINEFLINMNFKTGLFTSPHLFSYEERIKINNENITTSEFDELINKIDKLAKENNIYLTEFELLTACAFYYFSIKSVDYVVLEVGLGGMFDATNVVNSEVAIITTIDFDHTERLGKTIEEIATQKAGIIKQNSIVVVDKANLGYEVIEKSASKKNSKLIVAKNIETKFEKKQNYAIVNGEEYEFSLLGKHQKYNLALALTTLEEVFGKIDKSIIKKSLKQVSWRFRLEYNAKNNMLIDGAHNPSGIKALRKFLDENFKNEKKTIIFGCLKNKEYQKMLELLVKNEDIFYFYEFDYPNALKQTELPIKADKIIKTIDEINEIIKCDTNLKVFCGSLYMLGNIFREIKI